MIKSLDHLAIIVSSEEVKDFYLSLGFRENFRKERKTDIVVLLEGFGMVLELFIDPKHPQKMINPEPLGLRHLALKVDKIETTAEMLNLCIEDISFDWFGIRYTYVKDPDGNLIELHE